ncbi:hypothetical protein A9Q81_21240 [Gammaproteobacteria bacterium 42_54_T18]|nr:hypothetical protein A9Q81_21240 [Gammaproteobacteria bacterium 42_54_T18]
MSDEECECPECPTGLPAYLATFADLMSLLMCFFVLLLAFSEMDAQKYKQVAGSMKEAFGVQQQIKADSTPKGTSIIAQEFSPGKPEPTVLNEVRQHTVDDLASTLDVECTPESDEKEDQEGKGESSEDDKNADNKKVDVAKAMEEIKKKLEAKTQAEAVKTAAKLMDEIRKGRIEVETQGRQIVIRVKEKGSFESGSATLRDSFIPVMDKIRGAIESINGVFAVSGHTDDIPISTLRFRSNWELSSARSVSVAHELLKTGTMDPAKFTIVGHGDTRPLVENDSSENRSINRRVEIIINQGENDDKILSGEEALPEDEEFTEDLLRQAGLEGVEGFEILVDEADLGDVEEEEEVEEEREISAFEEVPEDLLVPEPEAPSGEEFDDIDGGIDGFDVLSEDDPIVRESIPVEPEPSVPENDVVKPGLGGDFDLSVDPFAQPQDAKPGLDDGEFF